MASVSSRTISRAATAWPAAAISSAKVRPDLSSSRVRVSETVRTAILTGRNGLLSSIRVIDVNGAGSQILGFVVQGNVARPVPGGNLVQRRQPLTQAQAIYPQVGQHPLDEQPRPARRQGS